MACILLLVMHRLLELTRVLEHALVLAEISAVQRPMTRNLDALFLQPSLFGATLRVMLVLVGTVVGQIDIITRDLEILLTPARARSHAIGSSEVL